MLKPFVLAIVTACALAVLVACAGQVPQSTNLPKHDLTVGEIAGKDISWVNTPEPYVTHMNADGTLTYAFGDGVTHKATWSIADGVLFLKGTHQWKKGSKLYFYGPTENGGYLVRNNRDPKHKYWTAIIR